jgi:histidinol-phosphate aminotransferase
MSDALERIVGAHLRSLDPYIPGRPAEDVAREHGLTDVIKLASNENPLGPSPRALAAANAALQEVHRYPDGAAQALRAGLAARLGVGPARVLLGNGSNELITLLARLVLSPGDEAVVAEGAFAIYRLAIQGAGAVARVVPMRNYTHDLDAMQAAIGPKTRMVFVGNPNNPTGTIYRRAEWERFAARVPEDVVVLCDDAYAEYVEDREYPDTLREPDRHPLLVVLRTFSKIYGLAGLRVGYGIGPAALVDLIDRLRDPFNVNHVAQAAALGALDDEAHVARSQEVNRAGRTFFERTCRALGFAFVPSHANFLMVDVGDGCEVAKALERVGVIVRPVGGYGFPRHVRVSVGLPAENTRFAQALAALSGTSGGTAAALQQEPLGAGGGVRG